MKSLKILYVFVAVVLFVQCDDSVTGSEENDTTAPTVETVSPSNNADDVAIESVIEVEFNEEINASSVSFNFTDASDNTVSGSEDVDSKTATFTPENSLNYSADYSVSVSASDKSGNEMSEAYSWTFTTTDAPDTTPPEVVSTTPENGATGVDLDIKVEMSEPVDESSVNTENIWVETMDGDKLDHEISSVEGSSIELTITDSDNNDELVIPATKYQAYIEGIEDNAGNVMQSSYEWEFSTQLWAVKEKYNYPGISGIDAKSDGVCVSGIFQRQDDLTGFFAAKFNSDGLLEWFKELPGRTEFKAHGPLVVCSQDNNSLYMFSEKDKQVYFNRLDYHTGEIITEKHIDNLSLRDRIVYDNSGNVYFFARKTNSLGRLVVNDLLKVDASGNQIDKLDFIDSGVPSQVAANDNDMFTSFGSQAAAKIDMNDMEFEAFLVPEEGDRIPSREKVYMTEGVNKVYFMGEYEDEPTLLTVNPETGEHSTVTFTNMYHSVESSTLSSDGSVYTMLDGPGHISIFKVTESGSEWSVELNSSSDRGGIVRQSLSSSSEIGKVFFSRVHENYLSTVDMKD